MADYTTNRTALDTINIVLKRLGINAVSNLDDNNIATVATELLNDVLDDLSDHGDWPQLYTEVTAVSISSVGEYKLDYNIKSVMEIAWNGQVSPLQVVSTEDIRRLQRVGSTGTPRHMAVVKVSAGKAPYVRVHPVPTSADSFNVAYYARPLTIRATAGDNTTSIPFPSRAVVQGLYANMLLEENGGSQTQDVIAAYRLYSTIKEESYNRFTSDTGTDVQFVPTGGFGK